MTHLPLEICQMIVQNVSDDRPTLTALLLVSKNFLNEACRELYKTIYVRAGQTRNRLPLNNPIKRSYYGSLVRSLTFEPRVFYHTNVRQILLSTSNLKELHLLDQRLKNNVPQLLRTDYTFQLTALTVHARFNTKLLAFFLTHSEIRVLAWNPIDLADAVPSFVDGQPILPKVVSLKTSSSILDSPWFDQQVTVRHLWLASHPWAYVSFDRQQTEASRRVTSVRFPLGAPIPYLNRITMLFPNLRYLDVRHTGVSTPVALGNTLKTEFNSSTM